MNDEKVDMAEVNRIASLPLMERQMEIAKAIEAAYTAGWDDCDKQWSAHVLEVPAARA